MRDTGAFSGNANKRMKIDGNSLINNVINTHIYGRTQNSVQINNLVKPERQSEEKKKTREKSDGTRGRRITAKKKRIERRKRQKKTVDMLMVAALSRQLPLVEVATLPSIVDFSMGCGMAASIRIGVIYYLFIDRARL